MGVHFLWMVFFCSDTLRAPKKMQNNTMTIFPLKAGPQQHLRSAYGLKKENEGKKGNCPNGHFPATKWPKNGPKKTPNKETKTKLNCTLDINSPSSSYEGSVITSRRPGQGTPSPNFPGGVSIALLLATGPPTHLPQYSVVYQKEASASPLRPALETIF